MAIMKRATQPILPPPPGGFVPCEPKKDWETHPSLIAGMEMLNSYNEWVSEVLMPIAFMWIEEHYDEVYAGIAKDNKNDVGVVTAAAFELVKKLPRYGKWVDESARYEDDVAHGRFDPAGINPVWTKIAKKIRDAAHKAYKEEAGVLLATIRTEEPE